MRRLLWIACLVTLSTPGQAQEAFEADVLLPCLDGSGLIATCSPEPGDHALRLVSSLDWSERLLGLDGEESAAPWIVRRRLTLRLAAAWAPVQTLRLTLAVDGVPRQRGSRTDALGAPDRLGADLGRTALTALWMPRGGSPAAFSWGLASRLIYPLGAADSLTAPDHLRWQGEIWLGAHLPWLRPFANLGLSFGERARFRNLRRDEALIARLGLQLAPPTGPVAAGVEALIQTRLRQPFAQRVNSPLEILFSLSFRGLPFLEARLWAGLGALGASVPRLRLGVTLAWSVGPEKRTVAGE